MKRPWKLVRWAVCRKCDHLDAYDVRDGRRVRDHHCNRCGKLLERGACRAASALLALRRQTAGGRRHIAMKRRESMVPLAGALRAAVSRAGAER